MFRVNAKKYGELILVTKISDQNVKSIKDLSNNDRAVMS